MTNKSELEIPENHGDSPTEDDAGQSQTPSELEMMRIHLVTEEIEAFLKILHSLLVKRRYGFLRGALLLGLWAELELQIAEKRQVKLDSIREAFDIFLTLDKQEVQEMASLGYLAGHEVKIVDDIPLQQQADSFIQFLGLEELMEFNLSLGEEATSREAEG